MQYLEWLINIEARENNSYINLLIYIIDNKLVITYD